MPIILKDRLKNLPITLRTKNVLLLRRICIHPVNLKKAYNIQRQASDFIDNTIANVGDMPKNPVINALELPLDRKSRYSFGIEL